MKNLEMIWAFIELSYYSGFYEYGTREQELAKTTRDAMQCLMSIRIGNSKFWVFWILVLWILSPIAAVYLMTRQHVRYLKTQP